MAKSCILTHTCAMARVTVGTLLIDTCYLAVPLLGREGAQKQQHPPCISRSNAALSLLPFGQNLDCISFLITFFGRFTSPHPSCILPQQGVGL